MLIETDNKIFGYCLLIYYWSNEYGGNILHIDELYLKPEFRGKHIGTDFVLYLLESKFATCKAIELETMPSNERAREFFRKLGFELSDRKNLVWENEP